MSRLAAMCILVRRPPWLASLCLLAATPAFSQIPQFQWVQTVTKAVVFGPGRGVAVDGDGNCFLSGAVRDGANFNGVVVTTRGGADLFVAKYDPSGNLLWVRTGGGLNPNAAHADQALDADTDALGNCYVTGQFGDSAFFDTTSVLTAGEADVFLAKYGPSGSLLWVRRAGSTTVDVGNDIVVTDDGHSYVTGILGGAADFGDTTLASVNGDSFLAKYDPDGKFLWVRHFSGVPRVHGLGVALAPSGNCVVVGLNDGTATIGDSVFTSVGESDGFLAQFDASGNFLWAVQSNPPDVMTAVGVDATGAIYVTGDFFEPFFERNGLYNAKYDDQGQLVWEETLLAPGIGADIFPSDIAVDSNGSSFKTGAFDHPTTFGDTTLTPIGADMFIVAHDARGSIVGVVHGGSSTVPFISFQVGVAIAIDNWGSVIVSGVATDVFEVADTVLSFPGETRHVLLKFSDIATAIAPQTPRASGVVMSQNFPNPFNPGTVIRYQLPEELDVRLDVYDVSGRQVRSLVRQRMSAGPHAITWDGITDRGTRAATGVYFYRLTAPGFTQTRKMVLLK